MKRSPHALRKVKDAPHSTYRCVRCKVILSGLEPLDIIRLQTPGIGRCTVQEITMVISGGPLGQGAPPGGWGPPGGLDDLRRLRMMLEEGERLRHHT